jgi:MFS family permease
MERFGLSAMAKDLLLTRVSGVIISLGSLAIALSVTPWMLSISLVIYAFGSGFRSLVRSLLSALVGSHHQAMMNSALGVLQYLGIMVASPILYGALDEGIQRGGMWLGLPFFIATITSIVSTTIVMLFRMPSNGSRTDTVIS